VPLPWVTGTLVLLETMGAIRVRAHLLHSQAIPQWGMGERFRHHSVLFNASGNEMTNFLTLLSEPIEIQSLTRDLI